MSHFTEKQKEALMSLSSHRDEIISHLYQIEHILKQFFPEEFEIAYQHWVPQIVTALFDDTKWLPRGQCTMQQTLNRLEDQKSTKSGQGVAKYI